MPLALSAGLALRYAFVIKLVRGRGEVGGGGGGGGGGSIQ